MSRIAAASKNLVAEALIPVGNSALHRRCYYQNSESNIVPVCSAVISRPNVPAHQVEQAQSILTASKCSMAFMALLRNLSITLQPVRGLRILCLPLLIEPGTSARQHVTSSFAGCSVLEIRWDLIRRIGQSKPSMPCTCVRLPLVGPCRHDQSVCICSPSLFV